MFRLRGAYFAIGTWVVAEMFRLIAAQATPLGGGSGVSLPIAIVKTIGASKETREDVIFEATLASASLILAWHRPHRCVRGWGLALQAIRDSEIAAESSGVNVAAGPSACYMSRRPRAAACSAR